MGAGTPEKLDFEIEALDVINPTDESLQGLKKDIRKGLRANMQQVIEYCEANRVDYFTDWNTVLESGDDVAKDHFRVAMAMIMPDNSEEFISKLESGDEDAKAMLDAIVRFLKGKKERSLNFEEGVTVLSEDVSEGFLGKTVEHVGDRFKENPLASTLAGVVLVWIAAKAWNKKVGGEGGIPLFQWIVKGGAGALAINHFGGPIFNGQTLFEAIESSVSDGEQEELLALAEDHLPDASEATRKQLRYMFGFADVPFKYLLKSYESATTGSSRTSSREMDMKRLRRSIPARYRKNMSEAIFKQSRGREFYRLMEDMIGPHQDDIARAKERYIPSTGSWTTLSVLMDKYDKAPILTEAANDAVTGGTSSKDTTKSGGSKLRQNVDSDRTRSVSKAKGFEDLAVDVEKPKNDKGYLFIKGYKFEYTIDESKKDSDGVIGYVVEVGPGSTMTLEIGDAADQAVQETFASTLSRHVDSQMATEVAALGLSINPEWDAEEKEWAIAEYKPAQDFGHDPSARRVVVEFNRKNKLSFDGGAQSLTKLDDTIIKDQVASVLSSLTEVIEATSQMPITVTKIPDIRATATGTARQGECTISGGKFEFKSVMSASGAHQEYIFTSIEVTSSFVQEKMEIAQESIRSSFGEIKEAAPLLVPRSLTNRFWEELVDFKQEHFLDNYEEELTSATSLEDIARIYDEEVGNPLSNLRHWPTQLTGMSEKDAYKKLQHLGHPNQEYDDLFDDFLASIQQYDVQGLDNKNAEFKQEFTFTVLDIWYDRTKEFSKLDPASTAALGDKFTATEQAYLTHLQDKFDHILNKGVRGDAADRVISKDDFDDAVSELRKLPTYKEWQTIEGRDPALELLVGSVRGLNTPYTWEKVPGRDAIKITFDEIDPATKLPVVWIGEYDPSKKTIDVTDMEMTPTMIDAQVDYATAHPEFNRPFDNLRDIFDGMEDHSLRDFAGLDFETGFQGPVMQNKWHSLIDYKRQEAANDYRRDLTRIMLDDSLTPTQKSDAWRRVLDGDFGNKYLRDFTMYGEALKEEIHEMTRKNPREKFSETRFDTIYYAAQSMGYDSLHYRQSIRRLRAEASKFNYQGSEVMGARTPHDVLNRVVALQHKHTGFISDLPADQFSDAHEAYLRYVHKEIMRVVFHADEHGEGTTGTFYHQAMGADEIPDELDLLSFEEFSAQPDFLNHPDYTVDVDGLVQRCEEEGEDLLGDPCSPDHVPALRDHAEEVANHVFMIKFEDPMREALEAGRIKLSKKEKKKDKKRTKRLEELYDVAENERKEAVLDIMTNPYKEPGRRAREEEALLDELGSTLGNMVDEYTYTHRIGPIKFDRWPW
jgi:hypothetical protein